MGNCCSNNIPGGNVNDITIEDLKRAMTPIISPRCYDEDLKFEIINPLILETMNSMPAF